METLFRKVLVSERLPNKGHVTFFKRVGSEAVTHWFGKYDDEETIKRYYCWLEEIQLPSKEETELKIKEITKRAFDLMSENYCFQLYNYILGFINDKK